LVAAAAVRLALFAIRLRVEVEVAEVAECLMLLFRRHNCTPPKAILLRLLQTVAQRPQFLQMLGAKETTPLSA
jgi:hypothetical protein